MAKNYGTQILCVETNKVYSSRYQAAKHINLNPSNFSLYFSGKLETVGGYHWKLIDKKNNTFIEPPKPKPNPANIKKVRNPNKVYCPVERCRFKSGNRPCSFFFTYKDGTSDCPNAKEFVKAQKAQEIEELTKED